MEERKREKDRAREKEGNGGRSAKLKERERKEETNLAVAWTRRIGPNGARTTQLYAYVRTLVRIMRFPPGFLVRTTAPVNVVGTCVVTSDPRALRVAGAAILRSREVQVLHLGRVCALTGALGARRFARVRFASVMFVNVFSSSDTRGEL